MVMKLIPETVWHAYWSKLLQDASEGIHEANDRPLLAHYTSLENLENILKNEEVWLSNPLNMNDLEEVRFGIFNGIELVENHQGLRDSLGTKERQELFFAQFEAEHQEYSQNGALDIYVFCMSIHDPEDSNGRLSMWRGYGLGGKGAAVVFDSAQIGEVATSPLEFGPVQYGSIEGRRRTIESVVRRAAEFIQANETFDDWLVYLANGLFRMLVRVAIFTKHSGFSEEREWRLVYLKDSDYNQLLSDYFHYHYGPHGIEPKLKLPTRPIAGVISEEFSMDSLIAKIIIGPTEASPLKEATVKRMLTAIGKPELVEKLVTSDIPFRG